MRNHEILRKYEIYSYIRIYSYFVANLMKKIIILLLAVGLWGMAAAPAFGQSHPFVAQLQILEQLREQLKALQERALQFRQSQKDARQEIGDVKKELKQEIKDLRNIANIPAQELRQNFSLTELGNGRVEALIKAGVISEIASDGAFIKVKIFNAEYKAAISSDTNIVRNSWGVSELSEFSVGDIVNIHGFMKTDDYATIITRTIRNVSIQKLHGVFQGEIKEILSPNVFSFENKGGETLTVTTGDETKIFIGREAKGFADLLVGMTGLVRGVWDRTLSKTQALLIIMKPLPTPSPAPTPAPESSPSPTPEEPGPSPMPEPTPAPTV